MKSCLEPSRSSDEEKIFTYDKWDKGGIADFDNRGWYSQRSCSSRFSCIGLRVEFEAGWLVNSCFWLIHCRNSRMSAPRVGGQQDYRRGGRFISSVSEQELVERDDGGETG